MFKIFNKKFFFIDENTFQDIVFLFGVFIFFAILILGLFPGKNIEMFVGVDFFLYIVMLVATIAAIYFIIISFRRSLKSNSFHIGSSFKNKMAMAFVFVVILSVLPIIIVSNNFFYSMVNNLASSRMMSTINEAIAMSKERKIQISDNVESTAKSLILLHEEGHISLNGSQGRMLASRLFFDNNISTAFFIRQNDSLLLLPESTNESKKFTEELASFYIYFEKLNAIRSDKLNIDDNEIMASAFIKNGIYIVVYEKLPEIIMKRDLLFDNSFGDFVRLEYLQNSSLNKGSMYFIFISIFIIMLAILLSIYLSRYITRPLLELSDAARELSAGDFSIRLKNVSNDEIGILINSFNNMVADLDNNRKLMYQKQVLESWRDLARRVVHEVKNPLTPIMLSAEIMRKKFLDKTSDMENVILTGTSTIIEEVNNLKNILNEFTKFARLPEMKPEWNSIKDLLEASVNFFAGHESIKFSLKIEDFADEIYADKSLIKQAFYNIIQNGIDAVKGKGHIDISAALLYENDNLIIKIIFGDDGIGIKEEDLENVFKPGFTNKKLGTGLGLSIVEKIIMEHGGHVYCRPKKTKGVEFIVDLPVGKEGIKNVTYNNRR